MAGFLFFSRPLLRAKLPPSAFMVCSCVYSHSGPMGCTWSAEQIAAELETVTPAEVTSALELLVNRHILGLKLSTGTAGGNPAYVPLSDQSWVFLPAHHKRDLDLERSREIREISRAIPPTTDAPHIVGVGSRESREIETKADQDPEPPAPPTDITVERCRRQMRELAEKLAAPVRRYSTPVDLPDFDEPPAHLARQVEQS